MQVAAGNFGSIGDQFFGKEPNFAFSEIGARRMLRRVCRRAMRSA